MNVICFILATFMVIEFILIGIDIATENKYNLLFTMLNKILDKLQFTLEMHNIYIIKGVKKK